MWNRIYDHFKSSPAQQRVVELLLCYGLRVHQEKLYCGSIELSFVKVARAIKVDRRVVMRVVSTIWSEPSLRGIFKALKPTCHLKEMAPEIGWGVLEIIPIDASMPGILAAVSSIIADAHISIRQAIVDDFQLLEQPRLYIVTEEPLPGHLFATIRENKGVKGVVSY